MWTKANGGEKKEGFEKIRRKKDGGNKRSNNNNNNKQQMPKLEDLIPMSQLQSMSKIDPLALDELKAQEEEQQLRQLSKGDAAIKKVNGSSNSKSVQTKSGASAKAATSGKASKKSESKPKSEEKPRTIEEAALKVSSSSLSELVFATRARFPTESLEPLFLKNVATYLNTQMIMSDSEESIVDYPFTVLPANLIAKEAREYLADLIAKIVKSSGKAAFDDFVANIAHEMAKGLPVNGYFVMIQLLSEAMPELCLLNHSNLFDRLRNSYQNRPVICKALLWAVGQAGRIDLKLGIQVWMDRMLPLLGLRHYNQFVVGYLKSLVSAHPRQLSSSGRVMYASHFVAYIDATFVQAASLSKELQLALLEEYPVIKALSVADCSKDHELFEEVFKRLNSVSNESNSKTKGNSVYMDHMLTLLDECLTNNREAAIAHWKQMYTSHLHASAKLLNHLSKQSRSSLVGFKSSEAFVRLLMAFDDYNENNINRNREGLNEAYDACKSLLSKMRGCDASRRSAFFPWKSVSLVLLVAIVAIVQRDINTHGGQFKDSSTGHFLRDVGLYEHTVATHSLLLHQSIRAWSWSQNKLPEHISRLKTAASPTLEAVGQKGSDVLLVIKEYAFVAVDKAEEVLPGSREKLAIISDQANDYSKVALVHLTNVAYKAGHLGSVALKRVGLEIYRLWSDFVEGRTTWEDFQLWWTTTFQASSQWIARTYKWAAEEVQTRLK